MPTPPKEGGCWGPGILGWLEKIPVEFLDKLVLLWRLLEERGGSLDAAAV